MDDTEKGQDTPVTQSPPQEQETPGYTKAETQQMIADAVATEKGNTNAMQGRWKKAEEDAIGLRERDAQRQEDVDRRERASIGNDTDLLAQWETRRGLRQEGERQGEERRKIDEDKTALQGAQEAMANFEKEKLAETLATKHGVDAKLLTSLTDGSEEKMEAMAVILKGQPNLKVDQGETVGADGAWEQVRGRYIKNPYDMANTKRYLQMKRHRSPGSVGNPARPSTRG